ncbi:MAG: hypothetical protein COC05_03915 [Gammaproteobacteria bacterium]|nr:MAG: hypothetical protein COC05_03915 [Gammaproteobacteria bacterium]
MSDSEVVVLTEEDKGLIKALLMLVYDNKVNHWQVNNRVADIVKKMIEEIESCSERLDFVPNPAGITKVGLAYIRKELLRVVKKKLGRNVFEIDKGYVICRRVVAQNFRIHLNEARFGT